MASLDRLARRDVSAETRVEGTGAFLSGDVSADAAVEQLRNLVRRRMAACAQVRGERLGDDAIDDRRRRVERAGAPTLLAGHQPLEDAPQHLRIDAHRLRSVTARVRRLRCGEAVLLEQ